MDKKIVAFMCFPPNDSRPARLAKESLPTGILTDRFASGRASGVLFLRLRRGAIIQCLPPSGHKKTGSPKIIPGMWRRRRDYAETAGWRNGAIREL